MGKKGGRPPFELSDQLIKQIEQLAGYGLTLPQIAAVIGCAESTLRLKKHDQRVFSALEAGRAKAQGIIGKSLFERAKAGDVSAIRWWEMTRAGRSEKQAIEHTGAAGGPIETSQESAEERRRRLEARAHELIRKRAEGAGDDPGGASPP